MATQEPSYEQLQQQLAEAKEVIRALRQGEVDAIISERELALVRLRATEEALRKLTAELEDRVHDRTAQLEESNRRLMSALGELRAAQTRVLEAQRVTALATLAGAIAHEVSSPLMGVLNAVAFVRRHEQNPELVQALQDADEGLRSIVAISRNLLALGRPPERRGVRARVAEALDRALAMLAPDMEARGIQVKQDLPEDLPSVAVDEVRLQQVLTNLLTNARDAVEESAEKIIRIRAFREVGLAHIDVEDTGPGVPAEILPRLFQPFSTTKPGRGMGLGLNISRSLVEEHGGTLTLESPKPARFRITLPLARNVGSGAR